MDYVKLKGMVEETIPWVKDSGLSAEVLEARHVVLRLPKDRHLNHVGIVYAGSLFMLMEIAGAALFTCAYPFGEYVPINKGMEIKFLNMGVTDILCDLSISEEDAKEMTHFPTPFLLNSIPTSFIALIVEAAENKRSLSDRSSAACTPLTQT